MPARSATSRLPDAARPGMRMSNPRVAGNALQWPQPAAQQLAWQLPPCEQLPLCEP